MRKRVLQTDFATRRDGGSITDTSTSTRSGGRILGLVRGDGLRGSLLNRVCISCFRLGLDFDLGPTFRSAPMK